MLFFEKITNHSNLETYVSLAGMPWGKAIYSHHTLILQMAPKLLNGHGSLEPLCFYCWSVTITKVVPLAHLNYYKQVN